MTDSNIPESPEAIAYKLMEKIFKGEYPSKQEILDTYNECLKIVKNIG